MTEPMTPLWEVFIRAKAGLAHRHVGSVHAADPEMALQAARDVYTRRGEGVSLWVVPSTAVTASDPGDEAALFEPASSKPYRHPTFYTVPEQKSATCDGPVGAASLLRRHSRGGGNPGQATECCPGPPPSRG